MVNRESNVEGGRMKKIVNLFAIITLLIGIYSAKSSTAEPTSNEIQEGRYVLVMQNGRAIANTRVPAIILDSYKGIIWTCQNLQDGKPLWVKTDLGKEVDKPQLKKKYVVRMLEWQDADLRMPAVVLDVEDGIVWNCPNIVDGKAVWIEKDLKKDTENEDEGSK